MTAVHDPDFHVPARKSFEAGPNAPTSTLAMVSLWSGILAYFVFPVLGAIVAVVTGHVGLAQIRESGGAIGGRALAKAGLLLGYLQFAVLVVGGLVVAAIALFAVSVTAPSQVAATDVDASALQPGVRMSNEMTRADFELVDRTMRLSPDEEIIGCAAARSPGDDPELALLTTKRLRYLKEGRTTEFPLNEIARVGEDVEPPSFPHVDAQTDYVIDVERDSGARMRIKVRPYGQGRPFGSALSEATKRARGPGSGPK